MTKIVHIIGAGLAGSEAAYQLAKAGVQVKLYEQRPLKTTPVHTSEYFGELVCSNSLRAAGMGNAVGLMKEEMRMLDSLIMQCADATRVPAGGALAVDRDGFPQMITEKIKAMENIEVILGEVTEIPEYEIVIIATGPLTTGAIADEIARLTGEDYLHFHDAVAPIVMADSIDMTKAYRASRWGRGELAEGDYINCPMNKVEYEKFYNELITAELMPLHDFEKEKDFEGCMPVESMAKRGFDTLCFGPLKPVGLVNPHKDEEPYAVVQLRQDNASASMFNIVGFQTRLKWGEQKRVFSLITGLENAEFARFGVMHRNTYINSTKLLNNDLSLKTKSNIFFAGQITGVEGYMESTACGMVVAKNVLSRINEGEAVVFPKTTAIGGLINYILTPNYNFQPMNITFGLIEPLGYKVRKKAEKNQIIGERAIKDLQSFIASFAH